MPFLNNSYESQNNSFKSCYQPTVNGTNVACNSMKPANVNYAN